MLNFKVKHRFFIIFIIIDKINFLWGEVMKNKLTWLCVALFAAMLVPVLIGCPDGGGGGGGGSKTKTEALITQVSLEGLTDTPTVNVGTVITSTDWPTTTTFTSLDEKYTGNINIFTTGAQVDAQLKITASANATLAISGMISGANAVPADFTPFTNNGNVTFKTNNYLYVKVTSGDLQTTNYYRFKVQITQKSNDATLKPAAQVKVSDIAVSSLGMPNEAEASVTDKGSVALTTDKLTDAEIVAPPNNTTATVLITVADKDGKSKTVTANKVTLADGDIITIKVTASAGNVNYYKIEVQVGRAALMTGLTVGGTALKETDIGTPATTWAAATAKEWIGPSSATGVAATVSPGATVQYGVSTDGSEPTWGAGTSLVIAVNNIIGVKVTSGNGQITNVYKIQLKASSNADLDPDEHENSSTTPVTHTYGGVKATGNDAGDLGTASITLPITAVNQGEVPVSHIFADIPAAGFAVTAKTADAGATVAFATGASGAAAADLTFTNATGNTVDKAGTVKPANATDILYVKVTAADGVTVKYWALELAYIKAGVIKYGTPVISLENKTIDSIWDTVTETYPIDGRTSSTNENNQAYRDAVATGDKSKFTYGEAKCLWDETGVYVYVRVAKAFPGTGGATSNATFFGTGNNTQHQYDSVEIFINEKTINGKVDNSAGGYADRGGQYRLSPDGTNMRKSGDPTAATTAWNETYPVSGWAVSGTDPGALDGKPGYVIIMKVPFRYITEYPPANDKKIGFDLQINVSSAANTRCGVMVWKNRTGSNFQNCTLWGEATLTGKP
jgi:hypothetical protein